MEIDHNQAGENAKYLLKIILAFFFVTYIAWYLGGGPQRWNKKFQDMGYSLKKEHVVGVGVLKIEK